MTTLVVDAKRLKTGWKANSDYVDVRRNRSGRVVGNPRHRGGLGNPFAIGAGFGLEESLDLFRDYAEGRVRKDAQYRAVVRSIAGKTLVCACAPRGGITHETRPLICHGQILAEIAERLAGEVPF